jgi:hypothetical protein
MAPGSGRCRSRLVDSLAEHLSGEARRAPDTEAWLAVLELAESNALPGAALSDETRTALAEALATNFVDDASWRSRTTIRRLHPPSCASWPKS